MVKAHDRHQGHKAAVGNRHLVEGWTIRIAMGPGLPQDVECGIDNAGPLGRRSGKAAQAIMRVEVGERRA